MANAGTGILTAQPTPAVARRAWPRWLALGVAMIVVAVVSALWSDGGARLLLGALGAFLAGRGAVLLRSAPDLDGEVAGRARSLGTGAVVAGLVALVVALVSGSAAATVLLVGVPVLLIGGALALLSRGGAARRGGQVLGVWAVLVTALLVATGLGRDWDRAADLATIAASLAVAALGVPVLVAAANLRSVAAQPEPEPAPVRAGCGGCACAGGGCGAA